jgi:lipopolysaccharide export system permease protein
MIKLIDKYILKKFFSTFFFVTLIILAVINVIDFGEKTDDFINKKIPLELILIDYYINFTLHINNMLSPILVFIAVVFITSRMAARTEIVAILASGVSFIRLLMPYVAGAVILAIATFFLNAWVIPKANKIRVAFESKYIRGQYYFDQRDIHIKVAPETFIYMQSYNNISKVGYLFTIEKLRGNKLEAKLVADRIAYDTTKNTWKIDYYKLHTFDGEQERIESGNALDTALNLSPNDFESTHELQTALTLPELKAYINKQLSRGNTNVGIFAVEMYEKYTYPFAIIILTIMGVIVSARKSRQGTGWQIALGFFLAFVFITLVRMCKSMGQAGSLEPLTAALIPPLLFAGIAVLLYKTVPR